MPRYEKGSQNMLATKLGCYDLHEWSSGWVKTGWIVRNKGKWLIFHTLLKGSFQVDYLSDLSCDPFCATSL